jgi:hypothetical protein
MQCTTIKANGERCRAYAMPGSETCSMHDPDQAKQLQELATKRSAEARRERVEARKRRQEDAKLSHTELLRVRALERQEELIAATLHAAIDEREISALRLVWDRLEGKVADRVITTQENDPMASLSVEELLRLADAPVAPDHEAEALRQLDEVDASA